MRQSEADMQAVRQTIWSPTDAHVAPAPQEDFVVHAAVQYPPVNWVRHCPPLQSESPVQGAPTGTWWPASLVAGGVE